MEDNVNTIVYNGRLYNLETMTIEQLDELEQKMISEEEILRTQIYQKLDEDDEEN